MTGNDYRQAQEVSFYSTVGSLSNTKLAEINLSVVVPMANLLQKSESWVTATDKYMSGNLPHRSQEKQIDVLSQAEAE